MHTAFIILLVGSFLLGMLWALPSGETLAKRRQRMLFSDWR